MALSDARRRLVGRLRRRGTRSREGAVLVEGIRGVEEALSAAQRIRWAICSPRLRNGGRGERLAEALAAAEVDTVWVSDHELGALSDTEAPQGVLMVVEEPRATLDDVARPERLLVADGIRDPGNLGTLIRASLALGVGGVVALEGTTDPWNPKAVRSAAGACFHLPVIQNRWADVRLWMDERGTEVLCAASDGHDVALADAGRNWALVVGSEAQGVRAEVRAAATSTVAIPMHGGAESLNAGVAGAILLYELTRKQSP